MKNISNETILKTAASVALAAILCGTTAFAQGSGSKDPSGQAPSAGSGTTNVVVTNTAAQPVPVTVTNAPQSSVTINNTAAQAVPVKDQSSPDLQPFALEWSFTIANGAGSTNKSVNLPAGKRLIVDAMSGAANSTSPGQAFYISAATWCANVFGSAYVTIPFLAQNFYVGSMPLKTCVDPGSSLNLTVFRTTDNNGQWAGSPSGQLFVYGHYVDVP